METEELTQPSLTESQPALFTEKAIAVGTLLGGPLVGGYLISKNFKALNEDAKSKNALIVGIVVTILFVSILMLSGDRLEMIPDQLFHIFWAGIIYFIVKKYQRDSIASHLENGGKKGSGWIVFISGIVGTAVTLAFAFAFQYAIVLEETAEQNSNELIPLKIEFTKGVIYYDAININEQEAQVVGSLLKQTGYFNNRVETQGSYYKKEEKYCVRMFIDQKHWLNNAINDEIISLIGRLSKRYPKKKFCVELISFDSNGNPTELTIDY